MQIPLDRAGAPSGQYGVERLRHWLLSQSWFSSMLLPALPRRLRWALRTAYFAPIDLLDKLRGRQSELLPPRSMNFTGAVSDLVSSADAYVGRLQELAELNASSHVLDVGCGFGRLATGLVRCFDERGSYTGLDIVGEAIEWCKANITAAHPNCSFVHADVFNAEYNPRGRASADTYRFPFEDESFDIVVLSSVFTHMLPPAVDNYLSEIARVLRPDGRCVATYLMLTSESEPLMSTKDSIMKFNHDLGTHWLVSLRTPELSVGYREPVIKELHEKNGLGYQLYAGNWCGQPSRWPRRDIAEQDVVVARKREASPTRL
jgi:SAM-dependent methyltransferase